jgi:hypothetical protein
MTFCSIVGHAIRHTAEPMGPSTIDRSYLLGFTPALDTKAGVYYRQKSTIFDFGFWIADLDWGLVICGLLKY